MTLFAIDCQSGEVYASLTMRSVEVREVIYALADMLQENAEQLPAEMDVVLEGGLEVGALRVIRGRVIPWIYP